MRPARTLEGARVICRGKRGKAFSWNAVWKGKEAFKNMVSKDPEAVHYFRATWEKFSVRLKEASGYADLFDKLR